MMRRISEHLARTNDNELLQVVVCYESGIKKKDVRKMNTYCKTHSYLASRRKKFKFIDE
jgi:hypothetical protein